ncbi:MAG TPA: ABC transporter ATP-binding protein [Verrucomicrobiae bacterium]|nr:ABC transporter ATP-binding protein [Verrucomicrobiae bacterium]
MNHDIIVSNLVKKYGQYTAVNNISFTVKKGSIFAFLGTNGAGKTTTISCLTTALAPTSGEVTVAGHVLGQENDAIRRAIGVVFQYSVLDPLLSVLENLQSRAALYKLSQKYTTERINELAERIGLTDFLKKPYGTLSGGQKRRVDIARALLHNPQILFLDEPTAGLDPQSREAVWRTIYELQTQTGLTVFLTTHYMEETERANDVYVIHKGSIIAHGTPQALRAQFTRNQLRLKGDTDRLVPVLRAAGYELQQKDDLLIIHPPDSATALNLLKANEALIVDFEFLHGTMDDMFLTLAQNGQPGGDKL